MLFRNRTDAGRRLVPLLEHFRGANTVVVGLPRGGVPVAFEVARALGAPLDALIVRKVGAPFHPEFGLGAIAEAGTTFLDQSTIDLIGVGADEIAQIVSRERVELERRVQLYRHGRSRIDLKGRVAIVVDDGIATGGTVHAAVRAVRALDAARVVLAVPVASTGALDSLRFEADEVFCPHPRRDLHSVGEWYEDFGQVTDDDVITLLERADTLHRSVPMEQSIANISAQSVTIAAGGTTLDGDLTMPDGARGLVLFAHGSGSTRNSARNRTVAAELWKHGLATLLFDLLTPIEAHGDESTARLRFDVERLAVRLEDATDWVHRFEPTRHLAIGYFGASTGAAAALIAAAERPGLVRAIVSRGGRPDLAGEALVFVRAPTLLIVGGADEEVLARNEDVRNRLHAESELAIIPDATHLFPEPGALDEVASLASRWFVRHMAISRVENDWLERQSARFDR